MTKTSLITILLVLLILVLGCNGGNFEKTDSLSRIEKDNTVAIYWEPMHYDTVKASIKDRITFSDEYNFNNLPADRDLTLNFEFSGKMKEYMKHGKMIVRPYDSSVFVQRINNSSFKLRVNKPIDDWKITMFYEFTFAKPYFFSYIFDGDTLLVKPSDTIFLILRSEMIKPGNPWDYY